MLSCLDTDSVEEAYIYASTDVTPEEIAYWRRTYPNADELRAYYLEQLELFMELDMFTEDDMKRLFNIRL